LDHALDDILELVRPVEEPTNDRQCCHRVEDRISELSELAPTHDLVLAMERPGESTP
jgi:hypothetical protein